MADYSTLAATLGEISQRRADALMEERQHSGNGSGSFGYTENFYNNLKKFWDDQAGRGIQGNGFGMAPQILDTDKNMQWMKSALADPRAGGGGFSGGIMHTPEAAENIAAIKQERAMQEAQMQQRQQQQYGDAQRFGWNSNTGMPRNWSSVTGDRVDQQHQQQPQQQPFGGWGGQQPQQQSSNAPQRPQQMPFGGWSSDGGLSQGTIGALAQNPIHAANLAKYIALAQHGGGYGDGGMGGGDQPDYMTPYQEA